MRRFALCTQFIEKIEAFNIAEIVHHAKFAVAHADFLTLIDKRSTLEGHLHYAKQLAQLVAVKAVRAYL